jgi:hypothetical protein
VIRYTQGSIAWDIANWHPALKIRNRSAVDVFGEVARIARESVPGLKHCRPTLKAATLRRTHHGSRTCARNGDAIIDASATFCEIILKITFCAITRLPGSFAQRMPANNSASFHRPASRIRTAAPAIRMAITRISIDRSIHSLLLHNSSALIEQQPGI